MLVTESCDHIETNAITAARPTTARRRWRRVREVVPSAPPAIEFTWDNRRPGTAGFRRWTVALGERIESHGLAATSGDVDNLVAVARRLGVASAAADVLADPSEPEPARCQAFALVVSALHTGVRTPTHSPQPTDSSGTEPSGWYSPALDLDRHANGLAVDS
jgi:hypothetical protein